MAATYILKYTTNEERPYQDEDSSGHTFPSGHTSFAFAGAGYWQTRYGWRIGAPMYAAAAFVGYSRNHARMHSWLDIATGAALGVGFNILFATRYNSGDTQIFIAPTEGGAALGINARF
jgi:membrane-associated phospholipid phosphatase